MYVYIYTHVHTCMSADVCVRVCMGKRRGKWVLHRTCHAKPHTYTNTGTDTGTHRPSIPKKKKDKNIADLGLKVVHTKLQHCATHDVDYGVPQHAATHCTLQRTR